MSLNEYIIVHTQKNKNKKHELPHVYLCIIILHSVSNRETSSASDREKKHLAKLH